jgi:hypothetical protein
VFPSIQVNGIDRILAAKNSDLTSWDELTVEYLPRTSPASVGLAASTGTPRVALVETKTAENFVVTLAPYPDVSYRFMIMANSRGLDQAVYSAAVVSAYPDDMTVIQGIYALALKHQQDERAASEWGLFEDMEKKDRVRYGNMNNATKKVGLGGPHKKRNPHDDSNGGWMGSV